MVTEHQSPADHSSAATEEVLVRVEGVGKKFCRDLKKSLWYGMQDIASEARRDNLPVASKVADQVICLPIYPDLEMAQVDTIAAIVQDFACDC